MPVKEGCQNSSAQKSAIGLVHRVLGLDPRMLTHELNITLVIITTVII